jgi:ribosome-binding factor A
MSNRLIRINELVQREISGYLRKRYQSETACLTILGVQISSDLKTGKVFVSIIGSDEVAVARMKWLRKIAPEIRHEVGSNIVLKWTPLLEYIIDDTPVRAARILNLLDEIEAKEKAKPAPPAAD